MKFIHARYGLLALILSLAASTPALSATSDVARTAASRTALSVVGDSDRICHLAGTEKRKSNRGVHHWTVRQLDRWCVRDGRVVSVRQTLEVETGAGWKLISKNGTTRTDGDGEAQSKGRFHLSRDGGNERSCYPRITATLLPSGESDYDAEGGC